MAKQSEKVAFSVENIEVSFGDQIILDPVVDVQKRAFGAIKAIYR